MAKKTTTKSGDPEIAQRQANAERAVYEAEHGTGNRKEKGYAGSGDHFVDTATPADPGQASTEQVLNQEAGKPLNAEKESEQDKPAE
jgi:hypothetical protein